jgi:hypothetical protein
VRKKVIALDRVASRELDLSGLRARWRGVLPLLREAFVTPGWLSDDTFLAGYGAAQAVPGPLFTFAAYLGTVVITEPHGLAGAVLGVNADRKMTPIGIMETPSAH